MKNKFALKIIMDERITKAAQEVTEAVDGLAKAALPATIEFGRAAATAAVAAKIYRQSGYGYLLNAAIEQAQRCDHKTAVLIRENDAYEVWQCEWACCEVFLVEKKNERTN